MNSSGPDPTNVSGCQDIHTSEHKVPSCSKVPSYSLEGFQPHKPSKDTVRDGGHEKSCVLSSLLTVALLSSGTLGVLMSCGALFAMRLLRN